jgi:hypothetical protein
MKYLVRQYSPGFCVGFELSVVQVDSRDDVINVPWAEKFKQKNFKEFIVEDYNEGELIVSAYYEDGKHWVVSFACEVGSKHCKDWRYDLRGYQS